MKHMLCVALIVALPAVSLSNDEGPAPVGERVAYSCNLELFKAEPTKQSSTPFDLKRVPGAGRVLKDWRLVRVGKHVYELSGTVHDDNAFFPKEGAAVFLGNIGVSDMLRLVAKTDAKGRFRIRIDNRTFAQFKEAVEAEGGTLFRVGEEKPLDQEAIYRMNKYLYLGESGVDLHRYEIPYERAEPSVGSGAGGNRLDESQPESKNPQ